MLSLKDRLYMCLHFGSPMPRELLELQMMELYHCDPLRLQQIPWVVMNRHLLAFEMREQYRREHMESTSSSTPTFE